MHSHIVIHEMMHLQARGANVWSRFNEVTDYDPRSKMDEGFTEFFTRVLIYRMKKKKDLVGLANMPLNEIPVLFEQGEPGKHLPVYEGLKEIAMNFVTDIGFFICARAYFEGTWDNFTEILKKTPKYNDKLFWKSYHVISHSAAVYVNQEERVMELIDLGIKVTRPSELVSLFRNGRWVDPVLSLFPLVGDETFNL
eukprot:TRINITY_DN1716_c0_g1_i16.p1 TRINITY_DN1716_c0_g1~~TRINITY_DN1716_c0_g1_i16.p1  ORF type:complete len:196 (-),score=34.45 TRINITY_DN1716_c0_g1_i16:65-652(-)